MKGWHFGKYYPSDFNRPFSHFMHSRLVEHELPTVVFWYEGVCLAIKDPQLVIIRLIVGPIFPEVFEVLEICLATY